MSAAEELNSKGNWWLPHRPKERLPGTLTFHQQDKHGLLSIDGRLEIKDKKRRFTPDRILGELSNGLPVTLDKCLVKKAETHDIPSWSSSKSLIISKRILLGALFLRSKDMIFGGIYVRYYGVGVNKWLKSAGMWRNFNLRPLNEARFSIEYRSNDPKEAKNNNNRYTVILLAKPKKISPFTEGREEYSDNVVCLEIQSAEEKPIEDYLKVNRVVRDFLNFIFPQQVTIESIYGIMKVKKDSKKPTTSLSQEEKAVKILYNYTVSGMFKPDVIDRSIFRPYRNQNTSSQDQFQALLCRWFQLSNDPLINLYCGVMFNPEMYMEYLFLGLAQALEYYQGAFMKGKKSHMSQGCKKRLTRSLIHLKKRKRKDS
jgi:hypothetical protein